MLGKLTLAAIPYQNPIVMGGVSLMVLAALAVQFVIDGIRAVMAG